MAEWDELEGLFSPILVSALAFPRSKPVNAVPINAETSIVVTFAGISSLPVSLQQTAKAFSLMNVTEVARERSRALSKIAAWKVLPCLCPRQ